MRHEGRVIPLHCMWKEEVSDVSFWHVKGTVWWWGFFKHKMEIVPENHFKLYLMVTESLKDHLSLGFWTAAVLFEHLSSSASAGCQTTSTMGCLQRADGSFSLQDGKLQLQNLLPECWKHAGGKNDFTGAFSPTADNSVSTPTRAEWVWFIVLESHRSGPQRWVSGILLWVAAVMFVQCCGKCLQHQIYRYSTTAGGKLASMTQLSFFFHRPHLSELDTKQNCGCWWWNILSIPPPTHSPETHTMSSLLAIYFCSASDRQINQSWLHKARPGGLWCKSKRVCLKKGFF